MKTEIKQDKKGNTIISSIIHVFTEDGEIILTNLKVVTRQMKAFASFDIVEVAQKICERELREQYEEKEKQ